MRNRINKGFSISRVLAIIVVSVLIVFTYACYNKPDKTEKGKIIREKDFTSILTESYLADGLLSQPDIKELFIKRDSIRTYMDIIEKHGYSKSEMDTTLRYYFTEKPKRLLKIYDNIMRNLSEMEMYYTDIQETVPTVNVSRWNLPLSWVLPDTAGTEKPGFELKLNPPGFYNLTFKLTLFPDDESFNPGFTAWYFKSDSTADKKPTWLPSFKYLKDGVPHDFIFSGRIEGDSAVILKGWFYDFENNPEFSGHHVQIENIDFSFFKGER
jgi:hypothetical protein